MMRVLARIFQRHGTALPWLCLAAALAQGCASPLAAPSFLSGSRKQEAAETASDKLPAADDPQAIALRKALGEEKPVTQEQALAGVLEQLREIHAIDPEAEREVMADLQHAKPEQYAIVVETFRTALAYRQQLAERQDELIPATEENQREIKPPVQLASHETAARVDDSAKRAAAVKASLTAENRSQAADSHPTARMVEGPSARVPKAGRDGAPLAADAPRLETQSTRELVAPSEADEGTDESQAAEASASDVPVRAAAVATVPANFQRTGDWKSELNSSIADLEARVSPSPTSIGELHDHMRLRALALLAGREEEAYRPIPGASAAQQDYWSKQLFAMSAYLNAGGELDDKQRAAAALAPLDEARAKLSELATLQIRNAAFVTSVDGFGAYEPRQTTNFKPGQKVALYAEVENFRSESRDDGYHTSLGTSYQIKDKTGKRIDGKQFPDVADKCRNHRRDFHMQYEFPLPAGMAPGEYTLELTITDQKSGKIGQTALPFEVAGSRF
jgi:hypothetical protein